MLFSVHLNPVVEVVLVGALGAARASLHQARHAPDDHRVEALKIEITVHVISLVL